MTYDNQWRYKAQSDLLEQNIEAAQEICHNHKTELKIEKHLCTYHNLNHTCYRSRSSRDRYQAKPSFPGCSKESEIVNEVARSKHTKSILVKEGNVNRYPSRNHNKLRHLKAHVAESSIYNRDEINYKLLLLIS